MPCEAIGMFESSRVSNETLGRVLAGYLGEIDDAVVEFVKERAEALGAFAAAEVLGVGIVKGTDVFRLSLEIVGGRSLVLTAGADQGLLAVISDRGRRSSTEAEKALVAELTAYMEELAGVFLGESVSQGLRDRGLSITQDLTTREGARVLTVEL